MAINLPSGFNITVQEPVDKRLLLTKAEMLATVDAKMPEKYFAVCKDDGKLYLYNVNNSSSAETGKFRVFEGGSGEPAEYLKSASVSGNKLTLTKKDNSTVVFEPTGGIEYTAGQNIQISDQNVISATDTKYTAGANVQISNTNVISATDTVYDDTQVKADISSLQSGKLNKLPNVDDPTDPGYGWPYHIPYDVAVSADASKIDLTLKTLTLDNNITKMNFNKSLPGATTTTAGLMTAADKTALEGKQDKLTAGTNITIDENNVISATGGGATYTAGNGINIADNTISTKLGNGLKHTDDGNITLRTADSTINVGEFGVRVPYVSTSLDNTASGLAVKLADNTIEAYNSGTGTKGIRVNQNVIQSKLTAGDNVSITNNIISAIDTKLATSITLGKQITATQAVGGIAAGKVYAATDTLAQVIEDLLGGSGPAPTDTKLYYSIGSTVPTSVTGMTAVSTDAETLKTSGYTWKNITLNNEYAFLAIDKSLGVTCYEILQNGFALGFTTVDLGDQILYYPSDLATQSGLRLVYHFEE